MVSEQSDTNSDIKITQNLTRQFSVDFKVIHLHIIVGIRFIIFFQLQCVLVLKLPLYLEKALPFHFTLFHPHSECKQILPFWYTNESMDTS